MYASFLKYRSQVLAWGGFGLYQGAMRAFFSLQDSRAGIFTDFSVGDTGPLRIPLAKLRAAASPTDKSGKHSALP